MNICDHENEIVSDFQIIDPTSDNDTAAVHCRFVLKNAGKKCVFYSLKHFVAGSERSERGTWSARRRY